MSSGPPPANRFERPFALDSSNIHSINSLLAATSQGRTSDPNVTSWAFYRSLALGFKAGNRILAAINWNKMEGSL